MKKQTKIILWLACYPLLVAVFTTINYLIYKSPLFIDRCDVRDMLILSSIAIFIIPVMIVTSKLAKLDAI